MFDRFIYSSVCFTKRRNFFQPLKELIMAMGALTSFLSAPGAIADIGAASAANSAINAANMKASITKKGEDDASRIVS